jgi:hypothetical protein
LKQARAINVVEPVGGVSELASAMLAIAFAAVMLVAGQLYIQSRPERLTAIPTALTKSVTVGLAPVNLSQQKPAGVNRRAL